MNYKVALIREAFGLSQKEFGAKIGLSRIAVSSLERGITALNDEIKGLLCDVYRVNPLWLEGWAGEMFVEDNQDIDLDALDF
jgi:transcriptional regulator with XRE-family HTH domain